MSSRCALRRWLGFLMLSFVWVSLGSWRRLWRVRGQWQQMKTDTRSYKGFGQLNLEGQIAVGSAFQTCDHFCQIEKHSSVSSQDLHHGCVRVSRWGILLEMAQELCMVQVEGQGSPAESLNQLQLCASCASVVNWMLFHCERFVVKCQVFWGLLCDNSKRRVTNFSGCK